MSLFTVVLCGTHVVFESFVVVVSEWMRFIRVIDKCKSKARTM